MQRARIYLGIFLRSMRIAVPLVWILAACSHPSTTHQAQHGRLYWGQGNVLCVPIYSSVANQMLWYYYYLPATGQPYYFYGGFVPVLRGGTWAPLPTSPTASSVVATSQTVATTTSGYPGSSLSSVSSIATSSITVASTTVTQAAAAYGENGEAATDTLTSGSDSYGAGTASSSSSGTAATPGEEEDDDTEEAADDVEEG